MSINIDDFKPKSENHILYKMWNEEYGLEFQDMIKSFMFFLDSNKKRSKLKDKFFLKQNDISVQQLNQYIQSFVECTVIRYFADNFPENFKYEHKLIKGSDLDIECQFEIQNLTFNVEVKATSYINKSLKDDDSLKLRIKGNLDYYEDIYRELQMFSPNLKLEKRYDNNLGSHLKSTQSKLQKDNNKFCNVLILGCNDSNDIQNQYDYLYSKDGGFFSANPLIKHSEFDLIDIVFLTNLFFKHNSEIEQSKLNKESWQFEKSFIVGFRNPYSKDFKKGHLDLIESIIPNYTKSFKEYKDGAVFMPLKHFIHSELGEKRKIYHY